jgi:hypothetical protein
MQSHRPPPPDGLREVHERRAELEYPAPVVRLLNGLDRRLEAHNGIGDLIAVVARRPG